MHPGNIFIRDYSYDLPEDRIARYPLAERDASRLLIYRKGEISESVYADLPGLLPAGSLLVFNKTRVVEARILFKKNTGASIELFCLEPDDSYPDITKAMQEKGSVRWKCLIGGASKWKKGLTLQKEIHSSAGLIHLEADFIEKKGDHFIILFRWNPPDLSFADMLHYGGTIPLPPYIKRKAESSDSIRYQTIYAESAGSVAAPTAGLHFTESLFKKLQEKKIRSEFVTLHVGAGTFKPVKSETLADHEMHAEYMEVSRSLIREIARMPDQPIIAVGTTSLRTLESLYWMGIKIIRQPDLQPRSLNILQWDPYQIPADDLPASTALYALDDWMQKNQIPFLLAKTQLLIAPGYIFRIVRGLITNFHQPQSTLLLLISAFIGDDWKKVYAYALEKGFRFLSYGDGCLLFGKEH